MSQPATRTFRQQETFPSSPKSLYDLWLNGDSHTAFTGGDATSEPKVGGSFTAWNGFISGTHLELEPDRRIVQHWRTSQWPKGAEPSRLELTFEAADEGCTITLVHSDVPEDQAEGYRKGW